MNTPDIDRRVCERCGALLGRHLRNGLCSRCLARFTLLEPEGEGAFPVPSAADQPSPSPKACFGDYELLEEIAHGGMGVVYRARQISLNRVVAVKMLLFGQFAGKAAFERFRAEAETTARLQHPNIVAIHAIGETEGQPYFSMDYVAGRNLADLVRDRPLPALQAAGYVRKIALAVQYAHSQGVLHRDLKPANVLIDEADEPRVTDFGLARRLTDSALHTLHSSLTLSGQVIGSPNFMPPEQGAGKKAKVGPASDMYGLGALLYYLVTARPPFAADTFEATLDQVLHSEPVSPRHLNPGLPLDLETICLKCLEKDPARRYSTAGEMADELDRFLSDQPIRARPLGAANKLWRWCRRKPVVAAMSAAVLLLLLTVTVVSLTAARRIGAEARRAEQTARELRLNLYVADMNVAYQALEAGKPGFAEHLLRQHLPEPQSQDTTSPQRGSSRTEDLRGWEWRYLWRLCQADSLSTLNGHSNFVSCAVFSPDGRALVTAGFDQTVRIWDAATHRSVRCLTGFGSPLQRHSVAFSLDGRVLAVADGANIHLFETTSWNKVRTVPNKTGHGYLFSLPIAFTAGGKILSCSADGEIRQWDTSSWQPLPSLVTHSPDEFGRLLVYSADGWHFATAKSEGVVIWGAFPGQHSEPWFGRIHWPMSVAFSPNGKLVAAVGVDPWAMVWDAEQGKEMLRIRTESRLTVAVAFSPDGRQLAFGSADQVIRLYELEQGKLLASLAGHRSEIWALAYSPDGRTLASCSKDGTARIWTAASQPVTHRFVANGEPLQFSADSQSLVLLSTNSCVERRGIRGGNLESSFGVPDILSPRDKVVASPDGRLLGHISTNGLSRVWEETTGNKVAELQRAPPPLWPSAVFSPDSQLLAFSCTCRDRGGGGWVVVWDFRPGKHRVLPEADVYHPTFSPDGRILATGSGNNVRLWKVPDLRSFAVLKGHRWTINSLAFSPDGLVIASSSRDDDIRLWEVSTGKLKALLRGHRLGMHLTTAAFNPDGRTLVSGTWVSHNFAFRLWNIATGRELFSLKDTDERLFLAMFSPDGNALAVGGQTLSGSPPIRLFQAPSWAEIEAVEKAESK